MATLQSLLHLRPLPLRFAARTLHSSPSSRAQYFKATKAVSPTPCPRNITVHSTCATQDFDRVVSDGPDDRVVLVDFYADWCGPCHALSPILKAATETLDGHVPTTGSGRALDLLTIDVENQSAGGYELSQEFKVRALPTVLAFRGGKQVDKFVGALDKKGVHQFLDKL
ncbi:thioredoxin-like protein [Mycena albidolilacea]|uniref:Thioredoxin-like protein n=1 Tax=Mycena albidolilacea TaxID=1033008 RepID=A0AAD6ZWW6_9AGAR|nr:thioredoxin-like protein [Mycena albidolilacea]